jgi:pilus assembly protein FimV
VASAVGFGGINVTSSLGQPLVAEIELVAVDKADKSSLNAHLASPEAFKGAGIDYPYTLPKLKFEVSAHPNGSAYIKATSDQVVNEPFVSLLLELTWSSGRLLREYTFLLDPPGFVAEQPPAVAVKPIEPVIESAVVPAEPIAQAAPVAVAASAPQEATSAAAPAAQDATAVAQPEPVAIDAASAVAAEVTTPAETKVEPLAKEETPVTEPATKKPAENNHAPTSPVTVKSGDTLGKIANQIKSTDVSLERMLVALYRANAEEFDDHNMNRIKTGKILHLPEAEDVAKIKQAEAVKEVRAQVADWNVYRQKLAATKSPVVEQRAKQEVAGKISTSIAEKAPIAKEAPKEVLKLSKGEGAGDQTAAGGKAKSAQDKANSKVEDAIASKKALKDSEQRTALLEQNVKEMQRLVELKNQAAAQAEKDKKGAASAPASVIPLITSSVTPATNKASSSVAEAKPKPAAAAPKVVTPPPSFLDDVLGNPIYLGGGAAAILGLAGLGFVLFRRQKKGDSGNPNELAASDETSSASGRIASPVQSSPETGDFTHTITATPASSLDSDEVDPIGEADLFLNFGRDVQAEEVLKESLQKDPSNNAVKLKLMSIYASRKDTKSFYTYALEVKQSRDDASWAQAAAMGREIEPTNELYSGGTETTQVLDTAEVGAPDPIVDFDLGSFGKTEPALKTQNLGLNNTEEKKPFSGESTSILSRDDLRAAQDVPMDFDITATHPGPKSSPMDDPKLEVSAMDFDVSGSHVSEGSPEKSGLDIPAMDFDVTGGAAMSPAPAVPTPSLNLDDLVFDVPTSAPVSKPAPVTPAATSAKDMEFTLDFPSDVKPASQTALAPAKGVGLSDISLNLDEAITPETSLTTESKDEQWQEVATKLDLAKAYQEMGDQAGAREILDEVLRDGDASQKATAQALMQQLS